MSIRRKTRFTRRFGRANGELPRREFHVCAAAGKIHAVVRAKFDLAQKTWTLRHIMPRATLAGFRPVQATLAMTIPYLTLAASAVGGLIGGLIRLLPGLRRGSARRFLVGIAVALIVCMLVFGLYAVGVNVLRVDPKVKRGAALVFVISAMGAYFGSGLLGGPKPPPSDE